MLFKQSFGAVLVITCQMPILIVITNFVSKVSDLQNNLWHKRFGDTAKIVARADSLTSFGSGHRKRVRRTTVYIVAQNNILILQAASKQIRDTANSVPRVQRRIDD
ncbi:MAG TPA: hypothetical protein DCY26_10095 [Hyphomonas sp.]|nr:hypothetical protein [Hyphomonas sp.]